MRTQAPYPRLRRRQAQRQRRVVPGPRETLAPRREARRRTQPTLRRSRNYSPFAGRCQATSHPRRCRYRRRRHLPVCGVWDGDVKHACVLLRTYGASAGRRRANLSQRWAEDDRGPRGRVERPEFVCDEEEQRAAVERGKLRFQRSVSVLRTSTSTSVSGGTAIILGPALASERLREEEGVHERIGGIWMGLVVVA